MSKKIELIYFICNLLYKPLVTTKLKMTHVHQHCSFNDIQFFSMSKRIDNYKNNKIREKVICDIINNNIPPEYYENPQWFSLKKTINDYLNELNTESSIPYSYVECFQKGGRKFNYDFDILFHPVSEDEEPTKFSIEYKYNVCSINQTPQFVSPIKPSQYLTISYEDFFFENYLPILADFAGLSLPSKISYMKEIHSVAPPCMKEYQKLYYNGCKNSCKFTGEKRAIAFHEKSKEITDESIRRFIEIADIKTELLSNYLFNSQQNKIYMLYFKEKMILEKTNIEDYTLQISSYTKFPSKHRYEYRSKSGKQINILLRWKNGNGIAFPSFQIS